MLRQISTQCIARRGQDDQFLFTPLFKTKDDWVPEDMELRIEFMNESAKFSRHLKKPLNSMYSAWSSDGLVLRS